MKLGRSRRNWVQLSSSRRFFLSFAFYISIFLSRSRPQVIYGECARAHRVALAKVQSMCFIGARNNVMALDETNAELLCNLIAAFRNRFVTDVKDSFSGFNTESENKCRCTEDILLFLEERCSSQNRIEQFYHFFIRPSTYRYDLDIKKQLT